MTDGDRLASELRRVLLNLAASAPDQIGYLRSLGTPSVDELGLEFDDAASAALPSLTVMGRVTAHGIAAIDEVDRQLRRMSGAANAELWSEEALSALNDWEVVRQLAEAALTANPGL